MADVPYKVGGPAQINKMVRLWALNRFGGTGSGCWAALGYSAVNAWQYCRAALGLSLYSPLCWSLSATDCTIYRNERIMFCQPGEKQAMQDDLEAAQGENDASKGSVTPICFLEARAAAVTAAMGCGGW
jgi:hypothetical protein